MKINIKTCYNCGSSKNRFHASENGIILVQCQKCNFIFQKEIHDSKELTEAHKKEMHQREEIIEAVGKFQKEKINFYKKIIREFYKINLEKFTLLFHFEILTKEIVNLFPQFHYSTLHFIKGNLYKEDDLFIREVRGNT